MHLLTAVFASLTYLHVGYAWGQITGLRVQTQQGAVIGTAPNLRVRQFLGVPFGTAQRWTAPVVTPNRTQDFSATSFGNSCPQLISPAIAKYLEYAHQDQAVTEAEDCLSVNIWVPTKIRPQNTAVLVWIYGGGFQFGASALDVYNGANLVRDQDDLTIVSFNYRINIFGQPNAPQLVSPTASQNFGLLDQRLAIQWIHDNIAAFGGDPNRISIFGHSAGGTSADLYALAYPTDTIVKGIIQQSGNIAQMTDLASPTLDSATWNTVANAVGCGSSATPAQFTCMKAVSFQNLITATNANNIIFFKLVSDGILVFADYAARMASGQFLKVPVLMGTLQHEGDALTVAIEVTSRGNAPPFLTEVLSDISTQVGATCGISKTAHDRVTNGVTTWRYYYQSVFPGISTRQDLRAFHGSEIPVVFGTYPAIHSNPTANEIALSQTIMSAWAEFAKNPASGLTALGWPTYNPSTDSLIQLGNRANLQGASFGSPYLLDATCSQTSTLLGLYGQFSTILAGV